MRAFIGLEKYRIPCIIGTEPDERLCVQELLIDLKAEIDASVVVQSGELSDTVDYRLFAELSTRIAQEGKYFLIEKYAADLVQQILNISRVKSVSLSVRKPHPINGADYTFVELFMERRTEA